MTTQTLTLAEFLLARIAEDEEQANAATPGPWEWRYVYESRGHDYTQVWAPGWEVVHTTVRKNTEFIARFDPARVLAECEAKRRIVDAHPWETRRGETFCECCCDDRCEFSRHRVDGEVPVPCCETLRYLAQPYADHEGFREEWRVA